MWGEFSMRSRGAGLKAVRRQMRPPEKDLLSMLATYIRRALELPPHVAAQKAARLAGRLAMQRLHRAYDLHASTFVVDGPSRLVRRVSPMAQDVPMSLVAALPALSQCYLDHRFDLLGSGWVQVRHGQSVAGLEGYRFPAGPVVEADPEGKWLALHVIPANLPEARRLWQLVEGPYQPIDWQVDFKSGFRWDGRRHFRDLNFGSVIGADVKVPWELARLQHLPQLATAHLLATAGYPDFLDPAVYVREVRNQIIDFLATNPPRFGVNWLCPMDIGIRAANILLALDLLRAGGAVLDAPFESAVSKAVAAHARHILANLEWSTAPRSNHYLSDIAGVLFCAVYLPADDETDSWLDFAVQQLDLEVMVQFLADGGNFEGSTNYHRLSAEITLFSSAALLGVAAERAKAFNSAARHRLRVRPSLGNAGATSSRASDGMPLPLSSQSVARFETSLSCVAGWSKPDGRPPQIGDTDSGRLFKLHPSVRGNLSREPHEDLLDHRALLSAGSALFDQPPSDWLMADQWFDGIVVAALAGGRKLPSSARRSIAMPEENTEALAQLAAQIRALPTLSRREICFPLPGLVPATLRLHRYPDFGLIVLKDAATYVSLRCVTGYDGSHMMGHYHDDNLALELHHQGRDLIADPGSYLYTPLKEARNRYRSAGAHFVPRCEGQSAAEAISPFAMRFKAAARLVYGGACGFGAVLEGADWKTFRAVLIEDGRVSVLDGAAPGALSGHTPLLISEGYGCLSAQPCISTEGYTTGAGTAALQDNG
jgi:hypothetical protein